MLSCSKCNQLSNVNETFMFTLASSQQDFVCQECVKKDKEVLEQVKDVERAIPWSDEMERTDERWQSEHE